MKIQANNILFPLLVSVVFTGLLYIYYSASDRGVDAGGYAIHAIVMFIGMFALTLFWNKRKNKKP